MRNHSPISWIYSFAHPDDSDSDKIHVTHLNPFVSATNGSAWFAQTQYLAPALLAGQKKGPLFREGVGKTVWDGKERSEALRPGSFFWFQMKNVTVRNRRTPPHPRVARMGRSGYTCKKSIRKPRPIMKPQTGAA
ncbi:MAG: hypothetical protein GC154_05385 [bacterium]|nr:hypothetical protein [bacterium]